jgi:hypothetical protein
VLPACLPDGSSVKREFQALFCEKPEVQSLRLTLPIYARLHHSGDLCQSSQFATHRIYLPADDRRHYVAWSQDTKDEFSPAYWNELWGWYQSGGFGHVGAYLAEFDLTGFDAKAPPPKTAAFWDIVNANSAPEDAELADALEALGNPDALTLGQLIERATGTETADWLMDRRNRRAIPHRMERCGYAPVRNPDAGDGRWKLQDKRQVVYAKARLSLRDQIAAVRKLCDGS